MTEEPKTLYPFLGETDNILPSYYDIKMATNVPNNSLAT